MAFLEAGAISPQVTLENSDGQPQVLGGLSVDGWLLLVFFKVGCGTCKFSAPYFEKIYQAFGNYPGFQMIGISQDSPEDTEAFMSEHGASYPNLYDTTCWAAQDYGLTNVPTWFLVEEGGRILDSNTGFCRADLNSLSAKIAGHLDGPVVVISPGDDGAPELKPG